jgi:hypothetical protein
MLKELTLGELLKRINAAWGDSSGVEPFDLADIDELDLDIPDNIDEPVARTVYENVIETVDSYCGEEEIDIEYLEDIKAFITSNIKNLTATLEVIDKAIGEAEAEYGEDH